MLVDPFAADGFTLTELTAAINNLPYAPGRLGQVGIFEEAGLATLTAIVEEDNGVLRIVPVAPRGAPGMVTYSGDRKIHTFSIPHLPEESAIFADEVQGIRAFGSDNAAEVITNRRDMRLAEMRRNIDYTIESHRVSAVKGTYIDVNGTATSLFTLFGVSQQTKAMGWSPSSSSSARTKCTEVLAQIEDGLGGIPFTGARVFCGATFWTSMLEDQDAKQTYLNTQMANTFGRADPRLEFDWNGFTWERYRGTSAVKIPDTEAYAVPVGVPGLFLTRYAPANYVETVNTIGLPYYAKAEPMKMGKGWAMEAQSNPLNICTRPRAVIKLTIS